MRGKMVALALLACSVWTGAASSTVLNWTFGFENTTASDQTFIVVFIDPTISPIFGPVVTRLSFGMVVGDGARDGATVNIGSGAPGLAQGSLGQGAALSTVAIAGAGQSFAGEGGTAGVVNLNQLGVTNTSGAPVTFVFDFVLPISVTGRNPVQSTLARAFADGEVPDGGSIAAAITPDVMRTTVGSAVATLDLGVDTLFPPDAGVFGPESASGLVDCGAGCVFVSNRASFSLSAFDLAGFILRSEIGGSELTGPVAWTLAGFDDASFNCGAIGCNFLRVDLNFTLSPGDAVTFVGRFDVEPAAVPEPATAALLGLGLAVLGLSKVVLSRRRRAA